MLNMLADKVLMIEPVNFRFNEETAQTNSFQNKPESINSADIQSNALAEFNTFVASLEQTGVQVLRFTDRPSSNSPDSIFPNNWFSTHITGELILYPMAAPNRRVERRPELIKELINRFGYQVIDLSQNEISGHFLEGTGSIVFDHDSKLAYAAISGRTDIILLNQVAELLGYTAVPFHAYGKNGELIYHTNVMISVGKDYVIIGPETIDKADRDRVIDSIRSSGKAIISLSNDQIYYHFAGNMLQLQNSEGKSVLVLSEKSYKGLYADQLIQLEKYNDILLPISIPTIEQIGGGSVRCMLAEIF